MQELGCLFHAWRQNKDDDKLSACCCPADVCYTSAEASSSEALRDQIMVLLQRNCAKPKAQRGRDQVCCCALGFAYFPEACQALRQSAKVTPQDQVCRRACTHLGTRAAVRQLPEVLLQGWLLLLAGWPACLHRSALL